MKTFYQKQLLDTFSERLQNNFSEYCQEQNLESKIPELITYIIDQGLINKTSVKRYAILEAYDFLKEQNKMNKTQIVEVLANRFNITSRSVWNVLRLHKT